MKQKKYKYFLFDLDRTLWNFDLNARTNISRLIDKYSLQVGDKVVFYDNYDEINHILWSQYEKGIISKETLRVERFHQTLLRYGIDNVDLAKVFGEDYLDTMPDQTALMPYAMEVLIELKKRGGIFALVSNGFKEVQYRKLQNSGIADFFNAVMISEEQGVHKPSPILFKRALEAIGGEKNETLMIGDDFANDIEGAMIFGIDQFFYNYKSIPCDGEPTYNSNDLRDLLTITSSPL
ncbi:MAG: YjjG family noncanonical pyrimidine nucleotidase [Rikenellaceae bacterium]|nr:YjjG family noncanonical pyrimidine nucleotidase [Rikenellaceae bacterium]